MELLIFFPRAQLQADCDVADGKTAKNEYVYGKDNLPEKYTIDGGRDVTYTYDTLNRLQKTSIGTTKAINMGYVYWLSKRNADGSDKYRTTKIKQETIGSEKYSYDYDAQGNITSIKKMAYNADGTEAGYTTPIAEYQYDELGQLVFEKIGTGTEQKKYSYDAGGNLLKETYEIVSGGRVISSTVTNYGYEDTNWKDKLTSYDGKAITYDEIGNPLSYRGMTMTWQNGRQLPTLQKGTTAVSYTYDANSTRATKTVNGVKYTYQYIGGKLIHETRGEKSFHYYYDANGYLTSIKYRLTPTGQDFAYYASHNWRGDVIGLYNGDGDLVAKYEYDTWGKVTSVKDANGTRISDQNHVGNLNPFRYRGYYYDTESQLYYLMTRYYDPVTHRFINADGYFQSGDDLLSTNMSAYCGNNPVSNIDPNGTCYKNGKWMVMGHVPGADYYCYKCGGCDPAYLRSINPNKPPNPGSGYKPPKKNPNPEKVKNPNGPKKGWPSDDGSVWVPDNKQHGGEGWTEQYPDGSHRHRYPDGYIREALYGPPNIGAGLTNLISAAGIMVILIMDDSTVVGVLDDVFIPSAASLAALGWDQINSKCAICEGD